MQGPWHARPACLAVDYSMSLEVDRNFGVHAQTCSGLGARRCCQTAVARHTAAPGRARRGMPQPPSSTKDRGLPLAQSVGSGVPGPWPHPGMGAPPIAPPPTAPHPLRKSPTASSPNAALAAAAAGERVDLRPLLPARLCARKNHEPVSILNSQAARGDTGNGSGLVHEEPGQAGPTAIQGSSTCIRDLQTRVCLLRVPSCGSCSPDGVDRGGGAAR
jgi:hypothetical protein